jgi:hypothetical protein
MQVERPQRRTITLDLTVEQISWLDRQAAISLVSRSAYVRQFISASMKQAGQ